jgi:hypothetical protein
MLGEVAFDGIDDEGEDAAGLLSAGLEDREEDVPL